jgi:hypothetical protein
MKGARRRRLVKGPGLGPTAVTAVVVAVLAGAVVVAAVVLAMAHQAGRGSCH